MQRCMCRSAGAGAEVLEKFSRGSEGVQYMCRDSTDVQSGCRGSAEEQQRGRGAELLLECNGAGMQRLRRCR